jgi:sensor histidine kinase YesM
LLHYNRAFLFAIAVSLYLLVATLTEQERFLSPSDLIDAGCGIALAALIVFFALPRLLYRARYLHFATYCLMGVAVLGGLNEFVLDPLLLPETDPRRAVSRWGAIDVTVTSFSIAAIVAMFDNVDYQRRLRHVGELRSEAELAALKNQLNPHIVLNTLNNLYVLALEKDERAPDLVLMLSDILRYSLYETEDESASLAREVEILRSYIALQEVGIGDRAEITLEVAGEPGGRRIAPLLLLPLVENAIKHGSAAADAGRLTIRLRLDVHDDVIKFTTENPFDAEASAGAAGAGGIGLENLSERLRLTYPERHRLDIAPRGNTFHVGLTLAGDPA